MSIKTYNILTYMKEKYSSFFKYIIYTYYVVFKFQKSENKFWIFPLVKNIFKTNHSDARI